MILVQINVILPQYKFEALLDHGIVVYWLPYCLPESKYYCGVTI